jgi:BolA family transcriptional regulator, general stress-responsive regulator
MLYNIKITLMNINELIAIVKNKLEAKIVIQSIKIEDKSFLHKNHKGNQEGKFHLKLIINSEELAKKNKIESTKKIYNILDLELKEHIHSIQILLS